MNRPSLLRILVAAIVAIAASVAAILSTPSDTTVPIPEPTSTEEGNQSSKGIRTVVQNLENPWAIDIAEDGRIFLTEKPGRVRMVHSNGTLMAEPVVNIRADDKGEAGSTLTLLKIICYTYIIHILPTDGYTTKF